MNIIGITGTLGAGKGTVVDYLVREKGYKHFSVRGYLVEIIQARDIAVNRDHMVEVANELRANHSPSFIVDELYIRANNAGSDSIIESIRTPGEIQSLRAKGQFTLIAVDAEQETRYRRISIRNSETDQITFERFQQDEMREMTAVDPNKQNLKKCIEEADFVIRNDKLIEDLYKQVDMVLEKLTNSQ
ncbi:MAG: AAA family ATPase [Bacteroidota bacterium]|nr:AAA family ATPase [Bacteroidota bacterium]